MRESLFQSKIIKLLQNAGGKVLNLHGHGMQASGWPDIYVSHKLWRGWLEFKVDRNWLQELQRIQIDELCRRDDYAFVLWTDGDSIQLLPHTCSGRGSIRNEDAINVWTWSVLTGKEVLEACAAESMRRRREVHVIRGFGGDIR